MDIHILTKDVSLSKNDEKILKFIVDNINDLEGRTLKEISKQVYSSPATIVRLCKKLGFSGYLDFYYFVQHKINISNQKLSDTFQQMEKDFFISNDDFSNDLDQTLIEFHKYVKNLHGKSIVICATGFSGISARYLYKKLLVKGYPTIYSGGEDSSGIIERNIQQFGLFIGISKSGETNTVIEKTKLCRKYDIPTFVLTGNTQSRLSKSGDYKITIKDDSPLDSQNLTYNQFFVRLMYLLEILSKV